MNEMIERAARALWRAAHPRLVKYQKLEDRGWPRCVERARAVMEAMREPTDAMCRAGARPLDGNTGLLDAAAVAERVYQPMIDADLKETP